MARELTAYEREHVTPVFYGNPAEFSLRSVEQGNVRAQLRWTVDLPEDLAFVREVYAELYPGDPGFGQAEVLALLARRPELSRTD
jgi:spore coat polysaccharide biosynthesis protein SpsF